MILDDHFERIIILSLDPKGERAQAALAELRTRQLSATARTMQAEDGKEMTAPVWFTAGGPAWGCLQSHVRAIDSALRDEVESVLILEDDCTWLPESARLAGQFLSEVPGDWGQIYFGGQFRPRFPSVPLEGNVACRRAKSVHRTHAYAVARAIMPRLLQHVQNAPDFIRAASRKKGKRRHLDHQLEAAHRRDFWPVYVPSYWLAGQRANVSAVMNRAEPERWWQQRPSRPERHVPVIIADRVLSPTQLRKLHFGYNLAPADSTIDLDVERARDRSELVRTMRIVTEEAVTHRRLPAIHPWDLQCELLAKFWPAGVLRMSQQPDLDALWNPLPYPHPWLNPSSA